MIRFRLENSTACCEVSLDVDNVFTPASLVFEGDAAAVAAVKRALMSGAGVSLARMRAVDGDELRRWMSTPALRTLHPTLVEGEALWRPGCGTVARHDCEAASSRLGDALGALAAVPRRVDPDTDRFAWSTLAETITYATNELPSWSRHCRGRHDARLADAARAELRRLGAPQIYDAAELIDAFDRARSAGEPRAVLLAYWRILDGGEGT